MPHQQDLHVDISDMMSIRHLGENGFRKVIETQVVWMVGGCLAPHAEMQHDMKTFFYIPLVVSLHLFLSFYLFLLHCLFKIRPELVSYDDVMSSVWFR